MMVNEQLARYSARMRRVVTLLWAGCAGLVVLERFSAPAIRLFATRFDSLAVRAFACQAAEAFPELLFLLALWWVRETLTAFAGEAVFAAPIARMLDRVGMTLACAAAVRILVVPGICRLLGFSPGYWIAFDAAAVVVGVLGLALKVIAGALRHAESIQAELDEMF